MASETIDLTKRVETLVRAMGEACEICAEPIAEEHGHVVDIRGRRLLCACRGCYLLFVPKGAAQGRYRSVSDRYVELGAETFTSAQWEALQIPIGLAFFFHNSEIGKISAFYPGPGGATESQLSLESWNDLANAQQILSTMEPDIEATLVYRRREGATEAYIVPIDVCYELVGVVRMSWAGFDGGDDARANLDEFFSSVKERASI